MGTSSQVYVLLYVYLIVFFTSVLTSQTVDDKYMSEKETSLGELLFFDTILSKNKTQSCATCHNPEHAFIDSRKNAVGGAGSLGDDQVSIGNRNTPTTAYAMFSPDFHYDKKKKHYIGGQFLDGRALDLKEQAGGPPVNPIEMNMPSKESMSKRLKDSIAYNFLFKDMYGDDVFDDSNKTYEMMTQAIAKFETSKVFRAFDSKYDRYLEGKYELSVLEDLGRTIFFSNNNNNCASCHVFKKEDARGETFTNYRYHNIGTPQNHDLMAKNIVDPKTFIDLGLMQNPKIKSLKNAKDYAGKFKVPTLRNVAVTAPYMHNGVFKDLKTVIEFYDMYINTKRTINPETNKTWAKAEVPIDKEDMKLLRKGRILSERKVQALLAFMILLTDKRYEHLIPNNP